jgi:hypothetical protein
VGDPIEDDIKRRIDRMVRLPGQGDDAATAESFAARANTEMAMLRMVFYPGMLDWAEEDAGQHARDLFESGGPAAAQEFLDFLRAQWEARMEEMDPDGSFRDSSRKKMIETLAVRGWTEEYMRHCVETGTTPVDWPGPPWGPPRPPEG